MWAQWDNEQGRLVSMARHLPVSLEGRDVATLAELGWRQVVTREPEDFIARFPSLRGSSLFELQPDGRILQTFPDADYSVAAVRRELVRSVKQDAGRELNGTDWYVVRKAETGAEIPDDILGLRERIREHTVWLEEQIATLSPRELVEYNWMFPKSVDQVMVNGVATVFPEPVLMEPPPSGDPTPEGDAPENPPPPPLTAIDTTDPDPTPPPPQPVEPPPPTTDGPIAVFGEGEKREYLDANGFPLYTVYDPNVGPQSDQGAPQ